MSINGGSRRNSSSQRKSTSDLTASNPEIFSVSPRPGGYIKHRVPTRSEDYIADDDGEHHCICTDGPAPSLSTASGRAGTSASCTDKKPGGRSSRVTISNDERLTSSRTSKDTGDDIAESESLNLLPITISCIMLMASEVPGIPEEYFTWTKMYLSCIKDEFGNHPPNVQGILNHIAYLEQEGQSNQGGSGKKNPEDEDEKQTKSETASESGSKSRSAHNKSKSRA